MPALYPENVQYSTPGTQLPPLGRALSGATSAARKIAPKKTSMIDSSQLSKLIAEAQQKILNRQPATGPSIYEMARGTLPSSPSQERMQVGAAPLGTQFLEPKDKTSPIPPEYKTWGADAQGRWVAPTEAAKIVSVPKTLGGGQYIIDPSQPGKLIKSERDALTDPDLFYALSPEDKMKISRLKATMTGGLSNIEIDHIDPLWAGGANTFENLQPLRTDQHDKKTRIQSVPLTLLTNGKIDKNKALLMSRQWEYISDNFDISKIPVVDSTGTIDLKLAESLAKEWEKTPHVTWSKFWKEVPLARRAIGEKIGGVGDKNLPAFLSGALKGFTQEATMGLIPTPEAKGTSENIGRIVGSALGFLVPFTGTMSLVGRIGTKLGLKALRIGKGVAEIGAVEKAAKHLYELKNLPYVEGAKIPLEYVDKTKQVLVNTILKNAGTFAAYGQLRTSMPTLFGDPDPGIEERVKGLITDSIFGGMTGGLSQNFSSYAKLGGITLGLGLMETGNVNDSFTSALTMMALHKVGPLAKAAKKGRESVDIDKKTADFMDKLTADMDVMANKTAVEVRSQWLSKEYEPYKKSGEIPKSLTSERINAENNLILDQASSLVKDGRLSPEDYERIKVQVVTSGKQLLDGGQTELVRKRNATREIISTAEALKKREQGMNFSTPDELIRIGENAPRDFIFSKDDYSSFEPIMKTRVTGMADQIDPVTAENQKRFQEAKKENRASSQVYIVRRDNMEPLIRKINQGISQKEIDENLHKPSEKPWNNVEVYGVVVNPNNQLEFLRLGWLPRGFRIEGSKFSINEGIRKLNAELKSNFPEYNPAHNKDLAADFLRRNNLKIGTANITGIGIAERSGQPWMEIALTEKGIQDAIGMKKYYEGVDMAESPTTTVRSAMVEANNNPTHENARKVIQSIAEKRYLDPTTEIDVSLQELGIKPPIEWVIIRDISSFFKEVLSGNKNLIKTRINEKFGNIIDDVQAKRLSDESENIGWRDIGKILYDGINGKTTNPEARMTYDTILSFFKSPEYRSSELSSYFADVPFVGVGKKISIPEQKIPQAKEIITTKRGIPLEKETLPSGQYWLEQNVAKEGSKWAKLAKEGHKIEHLMDPKAPKNGYVGKARIDGKEFTYDQAEKKFLKPKGIYDSAVVAEAPEAVSTEAPKKKIIKDLSSPKVQRAREIHRSLLIEGEGKLDSIESTDRRKYLSKARSVLDHLNVPVSNKGVKENSRIEDAEYRKIKQAAFDNLKARALNDAETKFPIEEEIRFAEGGALPKDPIIFSKMREDIKNENERILGINQKVEDIESAVARAESLPDKIKRIQETLEMSGKSKEEAKKIASKAWTSDVSGFHNLLQENIKSSQKNSYVYGRDRFIDDSLTSIFGKNWKERADLNSYFGLATKKGQNFWEGFYETLNPQGHYISQPKDIVRMLQKKSYDQLTAKEKDAIFGKRRKEAEEIAMQRGKEPILSPEEAEAYEAGATIKGFEQSESPMVTDMTWFDVLSPGRIGAEVGLIPDAAAGARDARALILNLISKYNSNVRFENKKYGKNKPLATYNQKTLNLIEEKIKKEMGNVDVLRKLRTSGLKEKMDILKRSVESMEKKKIDEGYLPEDISKTLEKNRALLEKLKKK